MSPVQPAVTVDGIGRATAALWCWLRSDEGSEPVHRTRALGP